jgi:hypothetical protein
MRILLILPLVLACATPYQPRKWAGGYTDQKLAADEYEIRFDANAYTESHTTRNYLLYRCAEVTKQNGYDHFILLDGQDQTSLSLAPNLSVMEKPSHVFRIKLGKGPRPVGTNGWIAADVIRDIGPEIKRP